MTIGPHFMILTLLRPVCNSKASTINAQSSSFSVSYHPQFPRAPSRITIIMCGCHNHSHNSTTVTGVPASMAAQTTHMEGMHLMREMSMGGMQMTFTTEWKSSPILFDSWAPETATEFAGAFIAIVIIAFILRALLALRTYIENHWANNKRTSTWVKRAVRVSLAVVTATLGYAVMLVTMTYIVQYFFAVVLGLTLAECIFGGYVPTAGSGNCH